MSFNALIQISSLNNFIVSLQISMSARREILAPKTPNALMMKEASVVFALEDTLVMACISVMVRDSPLTLVISRYQ